MPAVDRTPCTMQEPMDATIIQLADRAARRRTAAPPAADPDPAPGVDPVADRIREQVQALFTAHGRTLTDPATADAMRITMDGVIGLINGTLATGVIDPAQHGVINAALEGMRNVPRTL